MARPCAIKTRLSDGGEPRHGKKEEPGHPPVIVACRGCWGESRRTRVQPGSLNAMLPVWTPVKWTPIRRGAARMQQTFGQFLPNSSLLRSTPLCDHMFVEPRRFIVVVRAGKVEGVWPCDD